MARLLGPDMGSRAAFLPTGAAAAGKTVVVYTDSAGSVLANIAAYQPGSPTVPGAVISGSTVITDSDGLIPYFWFPDGLVDRLFVTVNGGHVIPIDAESNARIDDVILKALGTAEPQNHSLIAWTADPATVSAGQIAIGGTVYLMAMYVPRILTATKILWNITAAAVTATAGQNFVGLYDAAGTRLASVGVDAVIVTTGNISTTISVAVSPGMYWVAFVFNAATLPTISRNTNVAGVTNINLTAATSRFGTIGTGQTTLASSITPASISATGLINYWAALG